MRFAVGNALVVNSTYIRYCASTRYERTFMKTSTWQLIACSRSVVFIDVVVHPTTIAPRIGKKIRRNTKRNSGRHGSVVEIDKHKLEKCQPQKDYGDVYH